MVDLITERPKRFFYTARVPALTDKNARVARKSFEAFRRTIRPDMLWNPFVLRLTRELHQFGRALERGKRPKVAFCTPPQHGKSLAAEDFAAWISGRNPNYKTIYASYSEDLARVLALGGPDMKKAAVREEKTLALTLRVYWSLGRVSIVRRDQRHGRLG